jgi:hypothetical protein
MLDFFDINFDHSSYLKYKKSKYILNVYYIINYIIFDFSFLKKIFKII